MSGKFVCPKCGSDNIQRCSVIYQNGTISHSYTSRSGDYSVDTSGVESSALARSVAPPAKEEASWGKMIIAGFFAVASFLDGVYWLAVILALATVYFFQSSNEANEYNEKKRPREYKNWENSRLCHKCGNYFRID